MLIEFSVANFRSFREQQTFQMTAAPRLGKKSNTFDAGVIGERLPNLLKVAAIYGGNASGKSSLILAMKVIAQLLTLKPDATSGDLPVTAFRFDPLLADKPSLFDVHFIAEGVRYQFTVGATRDRITEESLIAYPKGKEMLLYSRQHTGDSDRYDFGDSFEGDPILRQAWRQLTGPKTLFLAQAVANSSEDLKQLRKPFDWLTNAMFVLEDTASKLPYAARRGGEHSWASRQVISLLQGVDVPVTEIRWEYEDSGDEGESETGTAKVRSARSKTAKTTLTHQTRLGSAEFDISEESQGTQNLIGFWFPWTMLEGALGDHSFWKVIIVDELDGSLHPEVVAHLVSKHLASGAKTQLIFTTHDTHLMSTKLLRRDQLWVTDRNADGATRLTSIHEFQGREGEEVEKRYFEGRYSGLPIRKGS